MTLVRLTIQVDPATVDRLRQRAALSDRSVSAVARLALRGALGDEPAGAEEGKCST